MEILMLQVVNEENQRKLPVKLTVDIFVHYIHVEELCNFVYTF